jgi:hypothetical protein
VSALQASKGHHPRTGEFPDQLAALAGRKARHAERISGRHAAITNKFNNWRSYREWAEKIRGTWEEKK